jgi:hypothetical protein
MTESGFSDLHMVKGAEPVKQDLQRSGQMMKIDGGGKYQDISFQYFATDLLPVVPGNGTAPEHIASKASVAVLEVYLMWPDHLKNLRML